MFRHNSLADRLVVGFVIGLGLVIPGVSGSLLAVILGVYQAIVEVMAKPFTNWRHNLAFLWPLVVGTVICLLLFSKVLGFLFDQYSFPLLYFFVGLVLGSCPALFNKAIVGGFYPSYLLVLAVGCILFFVPWPARIWDLACLDPLSSWLLGAIVGAGAVVPGLSVSFLLITIGAYEGLLRAVANVDLFVLVPLGFGFLPAAIGVSKLITYLFRIAYGYTYFFILGVLIGSLLAVFPGWPRSHQEALISGALLLGSFIISSLFSEKYLV